MTEWQSLKPILLLGAGFSRNWGGWLAVEAFEYLLGCPEILANPRLKDLLWHHQSRGGFEEALATVQREAKQSGKDAELNAFELAIARMFDTMNKGYMAFAPYPTLEFVPNGRAALHRFLLNFDAIFTLNQDNLLEQHYLSDQSDKVPLARWKAWHLPGMRRVHVEHVDPPNDFIWVPDKTMEEPNSQPVYKLHGSSLWRDPAKGSVMILGANKAQSIDSHEILRRYSAEFRNRLAEKGAQLMVIGYGFRDEHINAIIIDAVKKALKFYVIDPSGSKLAHAMNSSHNPGALIAGPDDELESAFRRGLIGASRRSLGEIFGRDEIEYAKVWRFFSGPN